MKMIGQERRGKTGGGGIGKERAGTFRKTGPVKVIAEKAFPLNPPADNMAQRPRRVIPDGRGILEKKQPAPQ